MTSAEVRRLLETDPDFLHLKRFDFSMGKLLERYPEGVPDRIIAQALLMTEDDVEILYNQTVEKLRNLMGVKDV